MNLYPLLETLAKVESKDGMLGLVRAHRKQSTGELADKLQEAESLLEQSASVATFLILAKRRGL